MTASVFIAWDTAIPDLAMIIRRFVHGTGTRDFVRALSTDELAQGSIADLVREEIGKCDRFVAFVDQANIQVAFEIGYALGIGKEVLLARSGTAAGDWLVRPPLAGMLVPLPKSISAASELLFHHPGTKIGKPAAAGVGVGGACFGETMVADVYREAMVAGVPGLRLAPAEDISLARLPEVFDGLGFFVLALPAPPHGPKKPDLDASAAAAVLAGYAHGVGLEVRVLRTDAHRRLEDVEDLTRVVTVDGAATGGASIEDRLHELAQSAALARLAVETDALRAWRTEQHLAHARLLPPFLAVTDQPEVEHVYVELEVTERAGPGGDPVMGGGGGSGDGAPKRRLTSGARRLADLLLTSAEEAGRWLVYGEPGAGKSTSARHMVHALCDTQKPITLLPIFTTLNALVDAKGDPFEVAARRLKDANPAAAALLPDMLRAQAREGRVAFLLDGLDEVTQEALASEALRAIRRLGVDWPRCPLLVFTRHAGARALTDARGSSERPFSQAEIRPLTPDKQRDMLAQWLGKVRGAEAAAKVAQRPTLADVVRNPLMLALVATLIMRRQELPPSRVTLYEKAIEVLLGSRHKDEPDAATATAADFAVFDAVSLGLQRTGGETWCTEVVEDVVRATGVTDPALWLNSVARKSGLLARHDGHAEPWRYLHRSFRELMVAREMARQPEPLASVPFPKETPGKTQDAKAWQTFSAAWGEPLALLCGLMGASRPAEVERLILDLAGRAQDVALRALLNADGLTPEAAIRAFLAAPFARDGDSLVALCRLHATMHPDRERSVRNALWRAVRDRPDLETLAALHWALTCVELGERPIRHANELMAAEPDRQQFFEAAGRPARPASPETLGLKFSAPIGGRFTMGSREDVGHKDEHPAHDVTLTPFRMAVTTVTAAQFSRLCRSGEWENPSPGESVPATELTWYVARLFAAWAGARLPTEAEWEMACRGGTSTAYWSGDTEADLTRVGWSDNKVHPVGELPPNPFGLHDMHGNVDEWCLDHLGEYSAEPTDDPLGPVSGAGRAVRGGAFWGVADGCRSAFRYADEPDDARFDLGFRLVRPAPAAPSTPGH